MAFTEAEKNSIVKITGVDRITLNEYLSTYASYVTSDVETDIRTELSRWDTAGAKFTSIEPRESNKGVLINAEAEKQDIRRNIANLLFLTEVMPSGRGMLMRA